MRCPKCDEIIKEPENKTTIPNPELVGGKAVTREYHCENCKIYFTTIETIIFYNK